jgi:hypothetical protein
VHINTPLYVLLKRRKMDLHRKERIEIYTSKGKAKRHLYIDKNLVPIQKHLSLGRVQKMKKDYGYASITKEGEKTGLVFEEPLPLVHRCYSLLLSSMQHIGL